WTQNLSNEKRPVMFWIHGGGFTTGSGRALDGSRLVLRGNVVVVSINYRLGPFGFLYIPEGPNATANVGLLDMVTGLKWVRENIKLFGGDPNNVTIFGESAGAFAIACLLAVPSAKGLFNKAILQSGTPNKFSYRPTVGIRVYENLMKNLGLEKEDFQSLSKIPYEKIINAMEAFEATRLGSPRFGPIIDNKTMPQHPLEAVKQGTVKDIDLFIGTNLDETKLWSIWAGDEVPLEEDELLKTIIDIMRFINQDGTKAKELIKTYKILRKNPRDIFDAINTDYMFRIPSIRYAEEQSQHNPNTYMYMFSWKTPWQGGKYGAMHALELSFVFGILLDRNIGIFPLKNEENQQLSEKMIDTWSSFARIGDPNNNNIPKLPPYNKETRATIIFDKEVVIENDPYDNERKAWDGIL
ncbi:MAG: carboxylesterase/lipase family protein, partial [Promethearchaeota archaeon]